MRPNLFLFWYIDIFGVSLISFLWVDSIPYRQVAKECFQEHLEKLDIETTHQKCAIHIFFVRRSIRTTT